jgi:hypothetical protein
MSASENGHTGGYTPGPWEYIPGTEHHGPYVMSFVGDVCDCYTMSNPNAASVRNGGESYPIPFQGEDAEANARLIAAAPEMLDALKQALLYIERDEVAHGRPFAAGNVVRAAISKAEGGAA